MERKLKILLLEDVESDAGLIIWSLEKARLACEYERVDTREEFVDAIRNYQPDVVLSDHSLHGFDSTEALQICKLIGLQAPFILVTGTVSEEFAVGCLKQGADDYVLKSNLSRLPSAIENALLQRSLKTKQRAIELELRIRNEELKKVNHELDNFVYSISHNLRAPLSTILGLLNVARLESEYPSSPEQLLNMMGACVGRLDETLKEILDYSRNARYQVSCEKIDFKQIVTESLDELSFLNGIGDIEKMIEVEEDNCFFSDSYRIKVIIKNLITNSVQYRDQNKEKRTLAIRARLNKGGGHLTVQDNGIGIPAPIKSRVFNMFFRGSEKSEGAGLGLYVVKEMINKLNGMIALESIHGEGTSIAVDLPNLNNTPRADETVKYITST